MRNSCSMTCGCLGCVTKTLCSFLDTCHNSGNSSGYGRWYYVQSVNGTCLGAAAGGTADATPIDVQACSGAAYQMFGLVWTPSG